MEERVSAFAETLSSFGGSWLMLSAPISMASASNELRLVLGAVFGAVFGAVLGAVFGAVFGAGLGNEFGSDSG